MATLLESVAAFWLFATIAVRSGSSQRIACSELQWLLQSNSRWNWWLGWSRVS